MLIDHSSLLWGKQKEKKKMQKGMLQLYKELQLTGVNLKEHYLGQVMRGVRKTLQ